MKKIIITILVLLMILLGSMIMVPFLFKDTIKAKLIEIANENIEATVHLDDVSLSLFRSFPKVDLRLDNFSIINKEPFIGDTLLMVEKANLKINISDLISGNYNIIGFKITNANVKVHLNKEGKGNYNIIESKETTENESNKDNDNKFSLKIHSYEIDNMTFTFQDDASDMLFILSNLNHIGKGNFENQVLDLDTRTNTKISFSMNKVNYMNEIPVELEAILGVDLLNQKYTFRENKALINRLQLVFSGFVQLMEQGQRYDLTFHTSNSSFRNFLALIPEEYSKNITDVAVTGDFSVSGNIKGEMAEDKIPMFSVIMNSENASFKYPDLPKAVKNIYIDTNISNTTGQLNDTEVNVNRFSFMVDEDSFLVKAKVRNIIKNPTVSADLNGTINLANLSQAYPIVLEQKLSGIFKANIYTEFDMKSVEKEQYQNVKNKGIASLSNFIYQGKEFINPFHITEASLNFSPSHIEMSKFTSKTGNSDLAITGRLDNFYGFLFNKETLKGDFKLKSNNLIINDFIQKNEGETSTETTGEAKSEAIKVPSFLNCTFTANASRVVYDNFNLTNVSGRLYIKNQKVTLENLRSDLFNGVVAISGDVSTKEETPTFSVNLSLTNMNLVEAFSQIEMLSKIAPIAKFVQGKLTSKINVQGHLNNELIPQTNSISGDMTALLLDAKVNNQSPLLNSLSSEFTGLSLEELSLNNQKVALSFENGKVNIKPFTINYKDISVDVEGTHGFDQHMDYNLTFNVPVQMLGNQATSMLSKLSPQGQDSIKNITVATTLMGTFTNPKVSTDMQQALTTLASQIAKNQVNSLKNKGEEALKGLFSSQTDSNITSASQILRNLNNKDKDTIKTTQESIKETAKEKVGGALKGLLRGNKEKSE